MKSETPETNEHLQEQLKRTGVYSATPEFARKLERERDALRTELERLKRGEFICGKCGIRKDAEDVPGDF